MANPIISLKLTIEKEKNRVVFAECDNDFVDILFSFLTLPMGTIVRLLDNKSGVGCFDKLYESVENLDNEYFETSVCKTMLLQPRSAAEIECEDLKININDLNPRQLYRCPKWDCFRSTHCLFSNVPGVHCRCGQIMDRDLEWLEGEVDTLDGVFVKQRERFIVTDDLHVKPVSTKATLSLLKRFGIKDADALENLMVDVGKKEIMSLLKAALQGKTPITNVFLKKSDMLDVVDDKIEDLELEFRDTTPIQVENDSIEGSKTVNVRLLVSKNLNRLVYIESAEDMVDYLVSFLTFPLGAIVKFLNKNSSLVCVDNLYHSVEALSDNCIKSKDCKEMLLSPMLAEHFGCSNRLFNIKENPITTTTYCGCNVCFKENKAKCSHGIKDGEAKMINPKLPLLGTKNGGGFAKKSMKFMVTSDMCVSPLSPTTSINAMKELQVPITSLVEREITCGKAQVLALLKACLTSQRVSSGFLPLKKRARTT